jgi:hypothetical protein
MHLEIRCLHAQKGHAFIQHPTKGSTPFRLGAGDAHPEGIVPPDGIRAGTTSVTFHARTPEHANEGHLALLPHDDGTLSSIKLLPSGMELLLLLNNHC